jgi:hypothetical protein
MFRWYRSATTCFVYLADVSTSSSRPTSQPLSWEPAFRKSRWFTRGWTLQELLAPQSIEFYSLEGVLLGDRVSLEVQVHDITGIAIQALRGSSMSEFSVTEKMSWSQTRQTKCEEDAAYSLLGIFDIQMPPLYGEGKRSSMRRLQDEISKSWLKISLYTGKCIEQLTPCSLDARNYLNV